MGEDEAKEKQEDEEYQNGNYCQEPARQVRG